MRHVWSVFCRTALTDRGSNSVSLLECVERVSAEYVGPEPPPDVPLFCKLVTLWRRSESDVPERRKVTILVQGPSGDIVRDLKYELDLSEHVRSRALIEINALPYHGNGLYEFVVMAEDDTSDTPVEVARIPVEIAIDHQTSEVSA